MGASLKRKVRVADLVLSEGHAQAIAAYAAAYATNVDEIASFVGAGSSDVWLVRKYQRVHADFEDCMVLAAAQRAEADYLATSDEALLRHAPVAALSVDDFFALVRE